MGTRLFLRVLIFILIPIQLFAHQIEKIKYNLYDLSKPLKQWDFSGDYLWLRSDDRQDVGYEFDPDFEPGLRLMGTYHYSEKTALFLQWLNFIYKTNGTAIADYDFGFGEGPTDIQFDFHNRMNIVNLGLETEFEFTKISVGFFGGVQYFEFIEDLSYSLVSNVTQGTGFERTDSSTSAVGPFIGLEFQYEFLPHFSLTVEATYSTVFVYKGGKTSILDTVDNQTAPAIVVSTRQDEQFEDVIGGQDADIGVSYEADFHDGKLSVKAGWIGIAYAKYDTRWEGVYLGAKWKV